MATYAIGDIQGCFNSLMQLLEKINFSSQDSLWLTGDLVNRGTGSLNTLRFLKNLPNQLICVLGNHDLHLLASAYQIRQLREEDTFDEIFAAADKIELCEWVRHLPLIHYDSQRKMALVHAGIYPRWTLSHAQDYAVQATNHLQGDDASSFLSIMYGNTPTNWRNSLTGPARWRFIINSFTRMRMCDTAGKLNFNYDGPPADAPAGLIPWFNYSERPTADTKILFGHWAALAGKADQPNVYALDTGCVWNNCLTALNIDTFERTSVTTVASDINNDRLSTSR